MKRKKGHRPRKPVNIKKHIPVQLRRVMTLYRIGSVALPVMAVLAAGILTSYEKIRERT